MTGVELIVAALAAGAAAGTAVGAKETMAKMISDTYVGLKSLVKGKLDGRKQDIEVLEADHVEAAELRVLLGPAMAEVGADTEPAILEVARDLLAQLEESAGKYVIDNRGAKGVLIGDHSSQTNHFQ